MKKLGLLVVFAIVFQSLAIIPMFSQTANRSYYVRADGDDENNNGRAEDTPYKTLTKAVEMASKGAVKTITVLGKLSGEDEKNPLNPHNYMIEIVLEANQEILITGKQNASEEEKAVLSGEKSTSPVLGINSTKTSKIRLENIEVINGKGEYGGGICVSSGTLVLGTGVKIRNNIGGYGGGGIWISSNGEVVLTGGEISNNTGKRGGGGIMIDGGSLIIESGSIATNDPCTKANWGGNGGGISMRSGTIQIKGGSIVENIVPNSGGAIYIENGTLTMSGGEIANNKAKEGGGIYIGSGSVTMNSGVIKNNNAEYGAGIYVKTNRMPGCVISGGSITENIADFVGGGVYIASRAVYQKTGGTISKNEAGDGEGLDIFTQQ
jgi:hypothetical protein